MVLSPGIAFRDSLSKMNNVIVVMPLVKLIRI